MATVVAGWDGSEAAERALAVAGRMAGSGDELVVVTVVPARLQERSFLEMLLPTIEVAPLVKPGSFELRARERVESRLADLKTGAKARAEVRVGDAADEILSLADEVEADHVVVGFKSYERHLRFDIGSVADKLVRHAPCAVTVVRWADARSS